MPIMVSVEKGDKRKVVHDYVARYLTVDKRKIATIFEKKNLLAIFLRKDCQFRTNDKNVLVKSISKESKSYYWLAKNGVVCYKKNCKNSLPLKICDCDYIDFICYFA